MSRHILKMMKLRKFITEHRSLLLVIFLATISLSAIASYFYFLPEGKITTKKITKQQDLQTKAKDITQDKLEDLKTLNILVLGYGGAGHQGGYLADVIQIIHLDFEQALFSFISVPRDLWVKLPNNKQAKINRALTLGENADQPILSGGQKAKQMTQIVTGLEIDYFVAVDFVGFKRTIGENLGGITVQVPETLDDPWYPITGEELNPCGMSPEEVAEITEQYSGFELEKQFECRYEHLHFEKGPVKMEGGDAMKYVRSRHGSSSGDFSRSQRQQAVMLAIKDKLFQLETLDDIPGFFKQVSTNITTDLDLEIIKYLAPALAQTKDYQSQSVIISTENVLKTSQSSSGQSILIPQSGLNNWQQVHQFVSQALSLN